MDDDVKAMIREALDLYKRELDIMEANRDRQNAIQEEGYRRIGPGGLIGLSSLQSLPRAC